MRKYQNRSKKIQKICKLYVGLQHNYFIGPPSF